MAERTLGALLAAIEEAMKPTYDLIYVDYRDQLTDEQAAMVVRGDTEALWDSTAEWECDSAREGADYELKELLNEVLTDWHREDGENYDDLAEDWEDSDEREEAYELIRDRDTGDWLKQLISQTPRVLCRVPLHEVHSPSPALALDVLGLEETPANVRALTEIIANSSSEYGVLALVFAVELSDVWALDHDCEHVEVTDPHVWLGNPYAGDGWCEQVTGTFRFERAKLRTDEDAPGYSWTNVTGGVVMSAYETEIRCPEPALAA